MGKNPELGKLDELFSQEKDFQITNTTYEERTGVALPKNNFLHKTWLCTCS